MSQITISQIQEQILNNINPEITIKYYLSFSNKVAFIQEILDSCIVENEGIKFIDYIGKIYAIDVYILKYYTNIDLTGFTVEDYDFLKENGVIEQIREDILNVNEQDFIELMDCIDKELTQVTKSCNSLEGVLARNLKEFLGKMPEQNQIIKILKNIATSLNKFTPEKYTQLNKMIDYIDNK